MHNLQNTVLKHNDDKKRFELEVENSVAFIEYIQNKDNIIFLTHTEVPSEYGGRGIASALARGVFDMARQRGDRLVLKCPFMAAWFAKHSDYADVVAG